MKQTIHTVLGEISPAALGTTLMHEHICCADWSMRSSFGPLFCDTDRILARAVEQVGRAKTVGVTTIVDGTAINLGRDIHLIRQVSQQTGVQIIASSGFYAQDEPWLAGQDIGYLEDLLQRECSCGISGTDAKPGIMKCAVGGDGITPLREAMLRLTAKVAVANDLPLFCHHEVSTKAGPEIVKLLLSEGMDPRRIILGHSGDSNDLPYLTSVLELGCYIGADRWPYDGRFNTVKDRIRTLAALCQRGYRDRIFLSHDLCVYLGFWESQEATLSNPNLYENADFTFLFRTVRPLLLEAGFTQSDFDHFLNENPQAFFSF